MSTITIRKIALAVAAAAVAGLLGSPARADIGTYCCPYYAGSYTQRVSVSSSEALGNNGSSRASVSGNGRYVAFDSFASNLVANDTNGKWDIFVRDRWEGTTERVSVGPRGVQADGSSFSNVAISDDGRVVAFQSDATNLVPGDTNGVRDVFVRDRDYGQTYRVSLSVTGTQVSGESDEPAISADGRYVAFRSKAADVVSGDTNNQSDIFLRDIWAGWVIQVSRGDGGVPANSYSDTPSISADGRYVAFVSRASNIVPGPSGIKDVYRRDVVSGTTVRVSQGSGGATTDGTSSRPTISDDGNRVVFESRASNLVDSDGSNVMDIFLRDVNAGTTTRVAAATAAGAVKQPFVSGDGTKVIFTIDDGGSQVFVKNLSVGKTFQASVSSQGEEANSDAWGGALSSDGKYAVFHSGATNLVQGDTDWYLDVFLRAL